MNPIFQINFVDMEQSPEERKKFLAELNEIAAYTATVLHGDDVSKGRIKQFKKYFNKTYKMLHRISAMKGEINNNSFKYCYGGKVLGRKVLLEIGIVIKHKEPGKRAYYELLITPNEMTLELVSRIIVEVYLKRNEIEAF
jgi:hypothetical protein